MPVKCQQLLAAQGPSLGQPFQPGAWAGGWKWDGSFPRDWALECWHELKAVMVPSEGGGDRCAHLEALLGFGGTLLDCVLADLGQRHSSDTHTVSPGCSSLLSPLSWLHPGPGQCLGCHLPVSFGCFAVKYQDNGCPQRTQSPAQGMRAEFLCPCCLHCPIVTALVEELQLGPVLVLAALIL